VRAIKFVRIFGGVDVAASRNVAYAKMGAMLNNPQSKKELSAARHEARRALGFTDSN
jgi:hypothetical protein